MSVVLESCVKPMLGCISQGLVCHWLARFCQCLLGFNAVTNITVILQVFQLKQLLIMRICTGDPDSLNGSNAHDVYTHLDLIIALVNTQVFTWYFVARYEQDIYLLTLLYWFIRLITAPYIWLVHNRLLTLSQWFLYLLPNQAWVENSKTTDFLLGLLVLVGIRALDNYEHI